MPSLCHPVIAVCEFTSRRASTVQDVNISGVFVALIHSFAPPELSSSFESCECFGNRLGQGLLVLAVLVWCTLLRYFVLIIRRSWVFLSVLVLAFFVTDIYFSANLPLFLRANLHFCVQLVVLFLMQIFRLSSRPGRWVDFFATPLGQHCSPCLFEHWKSSTFCNFLMRF